MIKVPATPAGIPAIESLIADGVYINVTLMFSMDHYDAVAGAYLRGLERCANPAQVASVASFFVSRVDTVVEKPWRVSARRKPRRSRARSPWPIPKWFTSASCRSFMAKDSPPCANAALACSGRCGPAPAPRTRNIPMFSMSKILSGLRRSIPCRRKRWRRSAITAKCPVRRCATVSTKPRRRSDA